MSQMDRQRRREQMNGQVGTGCPPSPQQRWQTLSVSWQGYLQSPLVLTNFTSRVQPSQLQVNGAAKQELLKGAQPRQRPGDRMARQMGEGLAGAVLCCPSST